MEQTFKGLSHLYNQSNFEIDLFEIFKYVTIFEKKMVQYEVKFKNIHSLKGEHEIDFENGVLGESGLFVITGATGTGKSSILDVITLALFNSMSDA